jgi:hypothetical protein
MKKTYRNIGFFHLIKIFINKNKMRRFDKKHNISKVNLLAEQRYLQSKGLINENIGDIETFKAGDNENIGDIETFKAGDKVSFDDYSKNPIKQDGVIIGKLNDKNLSPESPQFYYSVQLIPSGEKVPVRNDSLKKINKPIDKIETFKVVDENRFLNSNRQYEELLNNQDINTFVNNFEQYRDKALANVDFEINPAFSDVTVRFVDKTNPSTSGGFYDPLISGDRDNYESGQIMFRYNDTTCIFKGELQGDSIDYSYYKTIQTNYNKPRTGEALQVAITFEDMCKSFRFRLNKNEVPTMYYKK